MRYKKCAVFAPQVKQGIASLGLMRYKKCAVFAPQIKQGIASLGLMRYKKCAVFAPQVCRICTTSVPYLHHKLNKVLKLGGSV